MEWKFHDVKMKELERLYRRINQRTQVQLQFIFDTFNINNDNLYEIADKETLERVKVIIDEYREEGYLEGYFGVMANNIYNRSRVRNSEILEFLIYGAFIDENARVQVKEIKIFKEVMSHYYSEGINQVREARKHAPLFCIIPDSIFLHLMSTKNATGYTWEEYNSIHNQNTAQNIYRQACYYIQQGIKLKIKLDVFQMILERAIKDKLNIRGDKISGATDLELIGLNNASIIEGIKREDKRARVKFVSVNDERRTKMCESLEGQIFYINANNEFVRYDGDAKKYRKYKCFGLVIGLNLPPINYHFHWCRSTVKYVDLKSLLIDLTNRIKKVIRV